MDLDYLHISKANVEDSPLSPYLKWIYFMFKLHIITLKGYLASVALYMVKSKKKKKKKILIISEVVLEWA